MIEIVLAVFIISIKFGISVIILKTLPEKISKNSLFRYFLLITTKNLLIFAIVIYYMQQKEYDNILFYGALFVSYIVYMPFEFNYTRKFFLRQKQ